MFPDKGANKRWACFEKLFKELDTAIVEGNCVLLLNCGCPELVVFLLDRNVDVSVHFFDNGPEAESFKEQFGDRVNVQMIPVEKIDYHSFEFDAIIAVNAPVSKWYWRWFVQQLVRFLKRDGFLYLVHSRTQGLSLSSIVGYFYDFDLDVEKIFLNTHLVKLGFPFSCISKLIFSLSAMAHKKILFCCRKSTEFKNAVRFQMIEDYKGTMKQWKKQNAETVCALSEWIDHFPEYQDPSVSILDVSKYHGQSILVLSPHPDDEIIGCGGAIVQLIENGAKVIILQMTTGQKNRALMNLDSSEAAAVRPVEAKKVANYLNADRLIQWPYADSEQWNQDRVNQLKNMIQELRPQLIFLPFVNDPHADHWAANQMLGEALAMLPEIRNDMDILGCEIWSLLKPNFTAVIDAELDRKETALLKYTTALKTLDYIKTCRITTAYNGHTYLGRNCFAEAFLKLPANEYLRILREQSLWRNGK